ncbi:unnamed protein product [Pocillopora meandrina]|uniref:CHAT domain-containing protein n=1 Tax=Pocillopora meandrina TaxID=46732 RepID=A0AAU9XPQ1_9CNID|nr:unnamed protein product [Pocillopora meandrina]
MNYHELHLRISKEIEDKSGEGTAYGNMGTVYQNLGKFEDAIELLKKHLKIAKLVGDRHGEASAYSNLGNALYSLGDLRRAVEYHELHLRIVTELGDKAGKGRAYGNLGNAYCSLGDFAKAISYHSLYLKIAKEVGDKDGEGRAYANLGIAHQKLGDYKVALEYHNLHLKITKETGDRAGEGGAFANLGNVFNSLGDFNKAKEYHTIHLQIAKELGDKPAVSQAYANLGVAYSNLGDFKKAIWHQELVLGIAKEVGDKVAEGCAYANLGNNHSSLGDLERALEYHNKHLSIASEVGDKAGEGHAYSNIGNDYFSLGDRERALEYHNRHLTIAKEVGDKAGEGRAYANLGNDYFSLGDPEKALEFHMRHLSITKDVGDRAGEGNAYANIGNAFFSLGVYQKAIEYFQLHLTFALEVKDVAEEGSAYTNLGNAYGVLGDFKKALNYYKKQLNIAMEIGDRPSEGHAYANLGNAYLNLGKLCESECCYKSSVRLFDSMREHLLDKDEWKISWRDLHNQAYTSFWKVQLKQGKVREALFTAEQGRAQALADLLKLRHCFDEVSLVKDIETLLDTTTTVVFMSIGHNDINLWVLGEGGSVQFTQVEVDKDFFQMVSVSAWWRCCCSCVETVESECRLRTFYKFLIAPIKEYITSQEILFVPDGPLFMLPYAAFKDHRGKFLSEYLRIRLTPSLTSLKLIVDCPKNYHCDSGALLVGDPSIEFCWKGNYFSRLPYAREEVEMIGRILKVKPLTGEEATKREVLERLSSVALIHIAAHGSTENGEIALSPNPTRSSEVVTEEDFILTMADVLQANVRARLVVLTCCHSGRGEIKAEGVVGIARAFLGSGASSLLVSLGTVDDEATFELMKSFYQYLVDGKSVSESLSFAQKFLRESEEFSDVKHWAPFAVIGNDLTLFEGLENHSA